jgi:type I restriction enzyme, R subunit
MNQFSEDNLIEKTAIKIFGELWGAENFVNAYSEEGDGELGRENQGQVVLVKYLRPALKRLNPDLSEDIIEQAIEILTKDRSALSLVNANHNIWQLLRDGVEVEFINDDNETEAVRVKVIDFDDPENNDFLLVSQLWVTGDLYKRRPDLVGFVNGLPLLLVELKASHKNLRNAYQDNIRDYKDTIPHIFWYNAFIIISNGIEGKMGTVTSAYEHFNAWKKIENEDEEARIGMETTIRGACSKDRFLDILENFTLFDDTRGERIKIVSRYFQLFGVNNSFERIKNKKEGENQLGVFWHTQGSGKSYSMIFLSQKVLRKLRGNFTFVVVTDRKELDKQIYERFASCSAVQKEEVHAESIRHLRELLQEDHRYIFTIIHKFGTREGERPPVLSERDNVIVMTDEAHRTQYDRLAQNMRIALPRASFIGFTGTPLMAEEEKTRETFGDYVSIYNFSQSVEDNSTVPLYYENRVPKLENINPDIQKDLNRVLDFYDLNPEEEEKIEREFSTFYKLITREDRLNKIAEDIVAHFTERGYDGKAMVVSIDKKTTIRTYIKVKEQMERYIVKLRIALSNTEDEREKAKIEEKLRKYENLDMAVVVSQDQNEIAEMKSFGIDVKPIRERMINEDLEKKFKDPSSNLRIAFVCAMWITGFDVLNLSTLYLDKPLKNHTLMQTITRANRVFPGKNHGLIVDYIGVFRNLQKALSIYAIPEKGNVSPEDIIKGKGELVNVLQSIVNKTKDILREKGLDINDLLEAKNEEKIRLVDFFTNKILENEEGKRKYLNIVTDAAGYYQAILPDPAAEKFYKEISALKVIASRVREVVSKDIDVSQVKKDLEDLLDKSIKAGEYVIRDASRITDLSSIDFEGLRKFFEDTENKNIVAGKLSTEIEDKIKKMTKKNKTRKKFMERLNKLLDDYNSGSKNVDEFFDQLVDLAKDLNKEEERAIKENLSEEELAIFDLLKKENLNPDEIKKVKEVAKELIERLKEEKLVLDWKKREETRADVKVTIEEILYNNLPKPYTEPDCEKKSKEIYFHIYDSYVDETQNVYSLVN